MTYCPINGVSSTTLMLQRREVGVVTGPPGGTAGQNIDLALIVAEGSERSKIDPAFAAHEFPLVHWAKAIWNYWLPEGLLTTLVEQALEDLAGAPRPWSIVYGPGAAMVATAQRLEWTVEDAFVLLQTMTHGLT